MGAVAHARSMRADPQSGPALPRGVTGFFHYNARWIVAEQGSIAGLGKSNYINRLDEFANAPGRNPLRRDGGRSSLEAGLSTSDYINRTEGAADDELGASILITRGLPVDTGAGLARLLDARERKKDRSYRCYGGRLPRVGTHLILSFRYGLSAEAATEAAWEHARMLSDRLGVPLEGRVHNKNGAPDHLHLLVGTRVVDGGKLGRKCRALDAVSEKHDGKRLVEGVLGPTIEALRADWAERMRRASGDMEIDHRSYVRRGVAIYPVAHVARSEIEYQRRRGRADWRRERSLELQDRAAVFQNEAAKPDREPRQQAFSVATPLPGVDRSSVEVAQARPADLGPRPAGEDGDAASGGPATREVGSRRETATPGIDATPMIAAYRTLKRAHRLTAGRERALATLAGVDVEPFRRAAADATDDRADAAGQALPLPLELIKLIVIWQDEDRRARAEGRCIRKTEGKTGSTDRLPDPTATKLDMPLHGDDARPHRGLPPARPAPAPDVHAGPGAITGSEALARALWDAHADDVLARAYDKGRSPPSDDDLSRQVALRLRAGGYDRQETGRALRAGGGASRDLAIEGALDRAFSPGATAWLDERPGYRAHASRVSERAETATYRRFRSEAMARLRRDLDEVWSTRRADVDRLMARHRADMAYLRDLRWRNRRLQNRGLVLAVLSVMVELAIFGPLMALEKAITAQERRELDDAARAATERLRALREEWRAAHGVVRGPRARRDGPEPQAGGSTRRSTSKAEAVGGVPPRPGDRARTLRGSRSPATASGRPDLSSPSPTTGAGLTPAASQTGRAPMRESAGQAGREPQDRAKRRGRSLSNLESRLKRSRRLPNASGEGAFAKAASWSALIRTIVADEPDPARQASVIERLMRKLADDHLKHRGAVAPSIGQLSPGSGTVAGAGSTDTPLTAPVGAVPASRAVRSEAVEATTERAGSPPIDADRTASGPARAVVLARTGPASSSRDGDGRTPDGSGRQGGSDGAVALPPGSVVVSMPKRSETRERLAAAQPLRPGQRGANINPVVSATVPIEHAASVARPVAPGNGEASADQHGRGKGLSPVSGADVRRRLVVRYALVLATCNAWTDDRKRRLAALAPVDPGQLWSLALDECRTCFGHGAPSTIDRTAASKLLDAVLREADVVGFGELAELRQAFLSEKRRGRKVRSRRDDDPGEL